MTIFDIIAFAFFGYLIGHVHALFRVKKLIKKVAQDNGIDLDELEYKESVVVRRVKRLEVEQINDIFYLYEKDTRDFICQASSIEELAKLAKEYKNIVMATVIHDNKVFMFHDGNSKEYKGHES